MCHCWEEFVSGISIAPDQVAVFCYIWPRVSSPSYASPDSQPLLVGLCSRPLITLLMLYLTLPSLSPSPLGLNLKLFEVQLPWCQIITSPQTADHSDTDAARYATYSVCSEGVLLTHSLAPTVTPGPFSDSLFPVCLMLLFLFIPPQVQSFALYFLYFMKFLLAQYSSFFGL